MLEAIIDRLSPHYCCSCDRIGSIFCDYCKYDIVSECFDSCIVCRGPVIDGQALCSRHTLPYSRVWCVGERTDMLETLINRYKFDHVRETGLVFADMLDSLLPDMPSDLVVVPVPTVRRHVRQRGFDHTLLMARRFAKKRNLAINQPIERLSNASQFGKNKQQRRRQASEAFACSKSLSGRYLLIDDVFTTGATVEYAARALRDAGADEVWLAVICLQPLEK